MELVKIKDEQGNVITFKRYNGLSFHPVCIGNVRDQLAKIAEYPCKPDDVILCTFPKSGTHWTFNIVEMLLKGTLDYSGTPIEMSVRELHEIEALDSPRVYATHLPYQFIPNKAKSGQVKLIHVMRNPKDVVTSYYDFIEIMTDAAGYQGNFDGFLNFFLKDEFLSIGGSWFTYVKEWEQAKKSNKNIKILWLRYEDLKKDLYGNIVKIAEFLELNHKEAFLRDVERSASFENLKKGHDTESGETGQFTNLAEGGRLPIYRKGVIGDWKNTFTVAQNEKFDKVYKEKMAEMGLNMDLFSLE